MSPAGKPATLPKTGSGAAPAAPTPDGVLRTLFERMLRIRRCEESLIKAYHPADLMRCPSHFCIGQEAAPAAISLFLQPTDFVFCHHRNHGYFLAKGGVMRRLFAEMHGRDAGSNRGLAGSQDISESALRFYSGAIVSGSAAIATGAAWAAKHNRTGEIIVAVFGDGALDQGILWECFNIAALKRLPILYLCENNNFSTYAPVANRHAVTDFVRKAAAFGLSGGAIKTDDPGAFADALGRFVASVRADRLPAFVEVATYRFCAHVGPESDEQIGYRTPEALAAWQARDPLETLRRELVPSSLSPQDLEALEQAIVREIDDAFDFAQRSPFPEPTVMFDALLDGGHVRTATDAAAPASSAFDPQQPDARLAPY